MLIVFVNFLLKHKACNWDVSRREKQSFRKIVISERYVIFVIECNIFFFILTSKVKSIFKNNWHVWMFRRNSSIKRHLFSIIRWNPVLDWLLGRFERNHWGYSRFGNTALHQERIWNSCELREWSINCANRWCYNNCTWDVILISTLFLFFSKIVQRLSCLKNWNMVCFGVFFRWKNPVFSFRLLTKYLMT